MGKRFSCVLVYAVHERLLKIGSGEWGVGEDFYVSLCVIVYAVHERLLNATVNLQRKRYQKKFIPP